MMFHASKVACPPSHLAHRLQTAFARQNVSCQGLCWRAGRRTAGVLAMSSVSSTVTAPLATPTKVGAMSLEHRVTLAPMTRLRMDPGTEAPKELTALFYEQRASKGGLLVTEAIQLNGTARGYVRAPVFETPEQMKGWKLVTDRVHNKGGYIFGQLVHTGRVSHNSLSSSGRIVAPSAVAANGQLYIPGGVKADYSVPHALEEQEIKQIVKEFARAARDAVNVSGFDGVELHGSNGYLIQQFLAKKTNQRTDQYGGSIANRARFALEVIDACIAEVGAERVAVKLSPGVTFSDLVEPEEDALETMAYLGPELSKRGLAYVCIGNFNNEPYFRFVGLEKPNVSFDIFRTFRKSYSGVIVANGGLSLEQADEYVKEGTADLAGFGVAFVATPNLPELVLAGKTTADINMSGANPKLWYSLSPDSDAENYTTFPPVPV